MAASEPTGVTLSYYRMCGALIESEQPLAELVPATGNASADVRVRRQAPAPFETHPWFTPEVGAGPRDDEFFALTSSEEGFVLWFWDIGAFDVSSDGAVVLCTPVPEVDAASVTHVLVDHVLPRALARQGGLVLHGSAVELAGAAVVFVGETGRGKSTLAAALARAGERLLSDDCVLVREDEPVRVFGSYPGLRLWPEHAAQVAPDPTAMTEVAGYTDKRRYAVSSPVPSEGDSGLPLARWYVLAGTDAPETPITIEPLSRRDALLAAVSATFRLDAGSREDHDAEFTRLLASPLLARARRLVYPRTLAALPDVLAAIRLDALRANPTPSTLT